MERDEEDATQLLSALRGAEPDPVTGIDVAEAVRTGRRRARGRRIAGIASVAGVVAAVAVTSTLLGRSMPPDDTPPVAPPNQFGLTHQFFRVGSAAGFTPADYETGRYRQRAHLRLSDPDSPRRADGTVTMYPRDRLLGADGRRWTPPASKAPDVNGRPAYYLDRSVIRPGAIEVAWEWAPGAWGFASLKGDGVTRRMAHYVAQSVLADGKTMIKAPVTVPASTLGERNRLIGTVASATTPGTRPSVALRYGPQDPPARIGATEPGWIAIGVEQPEPDLRTGATVGGRPAKVDGTRVTVLENANSALFAEAADPATLDAFGGQGRLRELAAAVTIAPGTEWPPSPGCQPAAEESPRCTNPTPD